jgi:dihydroxyacetone kinase-like protein
MSGLTTAVLKSALPKIAAGIEACADELNQADAKLGDGDLGVTMTRGMRGILETAEDLPEDLGLALLKCAQGFTKVSGSSYGTLLATGLMSAAKVCKGRSEVPWSEVSALVAGALAAMQARGKGELGDKSVLDALEAIRAATTDARDGPSLLRAADQALDDALDSYRDQPSKLGRARMFGDKSIGLDDPGMLALRRVVDALKG